MKEEKKSIRAGVAFVTILILIPVILRGILGMWSPDGGSGGEPKFYRGPVLPLTGVSGGENLTVERSVGFDFAPYAEEKTSILAADEAIISDTYRLTNPGTESVTVELAYPFEGALEEDPKYLPLLTLNGGPLEAKRLPSIDPGRAIEAAKGWEDFRDAVIENDYLSEALSSAVELDEQVIVYAVTDIHYDGPEELKSMTELVLSYDIPGQDVEVWTYLLGSSRTEEEEGREHKGIQFQEQDWGLVIVRGGDLENISFQGYNDIKFPPDVTLDGIEYSMERYETNFSQVIRSISEFHSPEYADLLYTGVLHRLNEDEYYSAGKTWKNFAELLGEVLRENVILYDTFTLTLQPGETVEVQAVFRQRAGTENSGFGTAADTYDMATKLGSSLSFSAQTAGITNWDLIEITDQNFGFDPENGITQIGLDLENERYYLRVVSVEE